MTQERRPDDAIDAEMLDASRPSKPSQSNGLKDDFIMALRFFSRLPTGGSPHQVPDLNRIAMALPLASVVIGVGPALLLVGGVLLGLPVYFAAALAVGAMIIATGAMADDALGDAADGLFGGHTVERRLEIMKDSRHGTYGVAALALFILLRVTALGAMAAINPLAAGAVWLAASIVGRSGALWLAVALPAARSIGAAATVGPLGKMGFMVGTMFSAMLLFLLAGPSTSLLGLALAVVLAVIVICGWTWVCKRLVGGQSGDLIGALGALVEIAVLAALVSFV